jgi:hypothetical protein
MPVPTITVEVGWTDTPGNIFTLDSSSLDSFDVLDGLGVGDFSGTYDDVSEDATDIRIRRGRSDSLATFQAGTAEFSLTRPNDPDFYNPNSLTSPIAFESPGFAPMRPVRIRAVYDSGSGDVTYDLFYGFIRTIEWDSNTRVARVSASDLFLWLSRTSPSFTIAEAIAAGVENTSDAIGLVLDKALWTDPARRDLAGSGGDEVDPTLASFGYPDGDRSALAIIEELLAAERGVFFSNGAGTAVYRDRNERSETTTITATFNAEKQVDVGSSIDLDRITNRVRVTRTGGSPVVEEDTTSQSRFGISDLSLDSRYIPSFSASENLAKWLIARLATPQAPVSILLENDSPGTLVTQLSIELGDRVEATVEFDALVFGRSEFGAALFGGTIGSYHVEQIEYAITGGGNYLSTKLLLSERGADGDQFLFGFGEFGNVNTGTFGY